MMNRVPPLSFPDTEPVRNTDLSQQALSTILPGTRMFEELTGGVAGGLQSPTERTAFTVATIYACVNLIASAIAALPLNVYRRGADGERDLLHDDALWWVFNEEMMPRWSAANGWEFIVQSLLLHGDGFAIIRRDRLGQPSGLEPIHPDRVYVLVTPDGERLVYVVGPDPLIPVEGRQPMRVIDQDDMLHIAGFGFDGRRGMSMLRYGLRMTGAVALATQDYSARFFSNGARPDFALQTEQKLANETVEQLRDQLALRHQGAPNAHKPIVLGNGLKVQPITMPADDMQLLETRQFSVEEICRLFGTPPFMVGHNEKTTSWGSGVESMGIGFVRYTLRQHLNKVQTEGNRKLIRTSARVIEFDVSELEKADTASLYAALAVAVGAPGRPGYMTTNEARARLNLKKKPGGDKLFTGFNPNAPAPAAQPPAA